MRFRTAVLPRALRLCAVPALASENPWPRIRKERIQKLLPTAMERAGVDGWIVICRENDNDPLAAHVGGENAGGTAAFLFFRKDGRVSSSAISPSGEATALKEIGVVDEVVVLDPGQSVWEAAAAKLRAAGPQRIAVNSGGDPVSDGLSWTQRRELEKALGAEWTARLVSAEDLVAEWLSVKLPEEVEIMRRAAAVTADLEIEAYKQVVPGQDARLGPRAISQEAHVARWATRTAGRRTRTRTSTRARTGAIRTRPTRSSSPAISSRRTSASRSTAAG